MAEADPPCAAPPYAADEPFFKALLTPHRSLGPKGFLALMGALAFGWGVTALFFLMQGAWPVAGFFGLDILAVWLAFRMNYRAGRAQEEVSVSRTSLAIRKVAPSGRSVTHRMNPFWTRFRVRRHAEIGITGMAVEARGTSVAIGAFLNPDDRESFAEAFSRALATARAG